MTSSLRNASMTISSQQRLESGKPKHFHKRVTKTCVWPLPCSLPKTSYLFSNHRNTACSVGWFVSLLVREEVLLAGLCERKILFRLKIYHRLRQGTAKRTFSSVPMQFFLALVTHQFTSLARCDVKDPVQFEQYKDCRVI